MTTSQRRWVYALALLEASRQHVSEVRAAVSDRAPDEFRDALAKVGELLESAARIARREST